MKRTQFYFPNGLPEVPHPISCFASPSGQRPHSPPPLWLKDWVLNLVTPLLPQGWAQPSLQLCSGWGFRDVTVLVCCRNKSQTWSLKITKMTLFPHSPGGLQSESKLPGGLVPCGSFEGESIRQCLSVPAPEETHDHWCSLTHGRVAPISAPSASLRRCFPSSVLTRTCHWIQGPSNPGWAHLEVLNSITFAK
jgi:hypothetical protein